MFLGLMDGYWINVDLRGTYLVVYAIGRWEPVCIIVGVYALCMKCDLL